EVLADGLEVEHVVEGRDRLGLRRRDADRLGDLLERLARQPAAVPLLRQPKRRQDRRPPLRVRRSQLVDFGRKLVQRSTSPITVSSEPTIAIRSATRASDMHVAVASSATNDGARNFTRQGRGPPSETT